MLQGSSYTEPQETLETLRQAMQTDQYQQSLEIPFGVVRSMLDLGLTQQAQTWLASMSSRLAGNWRFYWYFGVVNTLLGDYAAAQRDFARVLAFLPGEAAPKLAIAAVNELMLQHLGLHEEPLLNDALARASAGLRSKLDDVDQSFFEDLHDRGLLDREWGLITNDPAMLRFHSMRLYALVWVTNPTTVSSAFGLSLIHI